MISSMVRKRIAVFLAIILTLSWGAFAAVAVLVHPDSDGPTVAAGSYHAVDLQSNGTIVALADESFSHSDVITPVAAGYMPAAGPRSEGTVMDLGNSNAAQCNVTSPNIGTAATLITTTLTTTTLTSSANPSMYGQSGTIEASVSPSPGGGTIQFQDNGANLGVPVLANTSGKAICTTSVLSVGSHVISAVYSGNNNFSPSASTMMQTVRPNLVSSGDHAAITSVQVVPPVSGDHVIGTSVYILP